MGSTRAKLLAAGLFLLCAGIASFAPPCVVRAADDDIEKQAKKDLKSDNPQIRILAIQTLAGANNAKALKLIQKHLSDGKERSREVIDACAAAMGNFTDPEALKDVESYVMALTEAKQIYFCWLILNGLAANQSEAGAKIVQAARDAKSPWLASAALEAMGDSGHEAYLNEIYKVLKEPRPEYEVDQQIVPITAIHAAWRIANGSREATPLMSVLVDAIEKFMDSRIRYHAASRLAKLANLDVISYSVPWWREQIRKIRAGESGESEDPDAGHGRTSARVRPAFVGMEAVGSRIVFALDLSHSMLEEVAPRTREKREAREQKERARRAGRTGPGSGGEKDNGEKPDPKPPAKDEPQPLPWNLIKNKLDLAKWELIRGLEGLSEDCEFNVVVYHTTSALLLEKERKFVKGTKENVERFIRAVKTIEAGNMTNIHGAMMDAFQLTADGMSDTDPAADEKALKAGAHCIFFLTDGWASWSDDSKNRVPDPRRKGDKSPAIGDGRFIMCKDVLADFRRINKFRKVVVNTVGIGNHDEELMMGMAASSGGTYVDLSDH